MGRMITACVLCITSTLLHYIFVIMPATQGSLHLMPDWWGIIVILTLMGIIIPIPVAMFLNLRDWIKTRRS